MICSQKSHKGNKSQKHVVQESSNTTGLKPLLKTCHTYPRREKICNICQKYFSFAVYKAQKRRLSLTSESVLYLHYRRAQLMDDDCLATRGPTTSMFLYWINTNRMGTAKTTFAMFYIKKHFSKTNLYIKVS